MYVVLGTIADMPLLPVCLLAGWRGVNDVGSMM